MAWSRSEQEDFVGDSAVAVNPTSDQYLWFAERRIIDVGEVCSKFGFGDGERAVSGDTADDYHQDTLAAARAALSSTGEYDMQRTSLYTMSTIHNCFRGEVFRLDGERDYSPSAELEAWMSVPEISLGEPRTAPSCVLFKGSDGGDERVTRTPAPNAAGPPS